MSEPGFKTPEQEHLFAPFVRIMGRGKTGSRCLSRAEAREAFGMILRGETEAVQVGAFRDESVAREWLTEISRRYRSQFASAERTVQNAEGWYRSRFTGMSEQAAQGACAALSERRVTCMVVRPQE